MSKRRRGYSVSVTDLAQYAVDPVAFIKRRGRPENQKAARRGTRAHIIAGLGAFGLGLLLLVGVIALGVAALVVA